MAESVALVLRGSALRVILLFANLGVAFYLMPFVIHALGDRWYGMWTLVGTLMGYYGYLDFGLSVATQRFIAHAIGRKDAQRINGLVTTALLLFVCLGVICLVVTVVLAVLAPLFFSDLHEIWTFRVVILLLGISLTISFPMAAFNGLISGSLRYDTVSYIEFGKLVARTASIIYFVGAGYSIVALAVINLAVESGGNLARLAVVRRMFRELEISRRHCARDTVRELFGYGGKTFVNQLADLLRFRLDHLVIATFINLSAVTIFNIAGQLVHYFRELMSSLLGVLTPLYARYQAAEDYTALNKAYFFTSKLAASSAMLGGGAAIVFGHAFIELWMGPAYLDAYTLLVILIIPTTFFVAQYPGYALIYGLGAVGSLAKASIVEAVANFVLSIILVRSIGVVGVALGTAIPLTAYAIFIVLVSCKLINASFGDYLRHVTPVFAVGFALQVADWAIVQQLNSSSYSRLIGLFLALYPINALLMLYLTFSRDELKLLRETGLQALGAKSRA